MLLGGWYIRHLSPYGSLKSQILPVASGLARGSPKPKFSQVDALSCAFVPESVIWGLRKERNGSSSLISVGTVWPDRFCSRPQLWFLLLSPVERLLLIFNFGLIIPFSAGVSRRLPHFCFYELRQCWLLLLENKKLDGHGRHWYFRQRGDHATGNGFCFFPPVLTSLPWLLLVIFCTFPSHTVMRVLYMQDA